MKTKPNIAPVSTLQPYLYRNNVTQQFDCPGSGYSRSFPTSEKFRAHLLTDVYSGSKTTCPFYLKIFRTTTALVAHYKSASRRYRIRKQFNYGEVLRDITGGLVGAEGHRANGSVKYVANPVIQ